MNVSQYSILNERLDTKLIENNLEYGIKFVGLINKNGRLKNYIKNEKFVLSDKTSEMLFMSLRLQNSLQNDFTNEFGKVIKITIEHEKLKFLLFPLGSLVGFAIIKRKINESKIKNKVISNLNFLINKTEIEMTV